MGITYSSVVDAPQALTFAWHERPGAVRRLTPPWQPVTVAQEAERLADGTAVLRLPGGLSWVAAHEGYDPPHAFTDRLTSLPLRWRHTHRFSAVSETATRVTDTVDTPVPERFLAPMFTYRHRQLADDLAVLQAMAAYAPDPLTVAVTGASGLVGETLTALLGTAGHRVLRLVRHMPQGPDERRWDPAEPDPAIFAGTDAVVHLAGASIAGRFTAAHKRAVRDSRIGPTARLVHAIGQAEDGPSVLVCASAIGYYGPEHGDDVLEESGTQGNDFLANLVADWERAAMSAEATGVRVVCVCTGIAQSPRGGVLRLLRPVFASGLGGPLGPGTQWVSWIDIDDLADIYYRAIVDDRITGPVNATAPDPVTNRAYSHTLARVLHRPSRLPMPAIGPKLLLGGEGARELALASQRVHAGVLERLGHPFRRPDLEACLRHQLGKFARAVPAPG